MADKSTEEIVKFLNTDALQRFKEDHLDYNAFTYAKTAKCLVIGNGSTFHEFVQPLIIAIRETPKLKMFNYLRVAARLSDIHTAELEEHLASI